MKARIIFIAYLLYVFGTCMLFTGFIFDKDLMINIFMRIASALIVYTAGTVAGVWAYSEYGRVTKL